MRFVKRLDSPPDEWLLLFSDGPKSTLAAWTTGEPRATVIPPGTKAQLTQEPQYFPLPPDVARKLIHGE